MTELEMPVLTVDEARLILRSQGAPEDRLTDAFVRGANNFTRRHPLLLIAIGGYLAQRGWQFRDEEFSDILSGKHA
jgi:hypothetical protein